jgi:hypothetical protein
VIVPALKLGGVVGATPAPLGATLELGLTPGGSSKLSILPGSSVSGSSVTFTDLNGLTGYGASGGRQTRGSVRGKVARVSRGRNESDPRRSR